MHRELRNCCRTLNVRAFSAFSLECALISCLLIACLSSNAYGQKRGEGPSRVVVGNVIKTERASLQSFVGTLQATKKTTVGSAVDGRVMKVEFDAGDPVGGDVELSTVDAFVGQSLVEVRTDTLDIEIQAAELELQQQRQALEELKLTLPQNLEFAKANEAGADSQLAYSKANYQRLRKLLNSSNAISQIEVEAARAQYLAAEQTLIGARVEARRLASTSGLQVAQAQSRIDAAEQEKLRLLDLRSQYTIRAPFAGVVTQKMTEIGQWVTRGTPLVEIVQLDPIEMIVNVPQEYTGQLQESLEQARQSDDALKVEIVVNGLDEVLKGELIRVIPQADLRSRSFPVRIRIGNPPTGDTFKLKPGMLGRASLSIGRESEMLLVKKDALVLGSSENKVYKIAKSGDKTSAIPVVVKTGAEVGSWVQVTGNLTEKDLVVIVGNERLRPGADIVVAETRTEEIDE